MAIAAANILGSRFNKAWLHEVTPCAFHEQELCGHSPSVTNRQPWFGHTPRSATHSIALTSWEVCCDGGLVDAAQEQVIPWHPGHGQRQRIVQPGIQQVEAGRNTRDGQLQRGCVDPSAHHFIRNRRIEPGTVAVDTWSASTARHSTAYHCRRVLHELGHEVGVRDVDGLVGLCGERNDDAVTIAHARRTRAWIQRLRYHDPFRIRPARVVAARSAPAVDAVVVLLAPLLAGSCGETIRQIRRRVASQVDSHLHRLCERTRAVVPTCTATHARNPGRGV